MLIVVSVLLGGGVVPPPPEYPAGNPANKGDGPGGRSDRSPRRTAVGQTRAMTVDVRTRVDGPTPEVDPALLFGEQLPAAFASSSEELRPAATWLDPRPLTVEVDGDAWTLSVDDGRVGVTPGATSDQRLTLSRDALTDLVADLVTPMAWFISGALDSTARLELLLDWWVLLRGALDGRTPYAPGAGSTPTFLDADGSPLDLGRSFRLDDDPDQMAHFLEEAGFVHIAGLFTEDEMAQISADMDRAAPTYHQGDGRSWWARTHDGEDRLVRMQGFDEHSTTLTELLADRRFAGLGDLGRAGHRFGDFGPNRIEALVKPLGVVEGISDVPWHKDCANGRHSYDCCSMTVGVSITGAGADSGQLRVVAGSNRVLVWPAFVRKGQDLPLVDLPTGTGDVTIHLSCTTHMAQPPVARERRVLYSAFNLPAQDAEAQRIGKAKLREAREAAPVTVSQRPATAT